MNVEWREIQRRMLYIDYKSKRTPEEIYYVVEKAGKKGLRIEELAERIGLVPDSVRRTANEFVLSGYFGIKQFRRTLPRHHIERRYCVMKFMDGGYELVSKI